MLSARTLLSKCRSDCWLASILPPRVGPPNLGHLRLSAADHGPQQLLGSGGGNSALLQRSGDGNSEPQRLDFVDGYSYEVLLDWLLAITVSVYALLVSPK